MAVSVDQFGKALVASGLMSADDVKSVWNAFPADSRPRDGAAFARVFVEQNKLSEFQVRQILIGKGNQLVFGEYIVLKEIGAGGMGQVYQAQHKRMKRLVALKVMSQAAMKDEAAVRRFQREVEAAARLEHPNIVTAFDAGRSGEVNYLVMQFVDGGDLSEMVKKGGPLPIEQAVDYVIQAANGLAFAHGEGVIHRDIKPANLLCDKKGVVKILDMGLARIESNEDGLTATEQVMGTVDYMSPEQASNTKSADARSDIYSLGCTLWYLLTGRKTYDGDSMIMRLMAHRDAALPSLVKMREDAPWPLEQMLHRMIAKRPDERFQSMHEVAAALAPYGSGTVGSSGSGISPTGAGSSIGMDGGPRNSELSAFLKGVGPTSKSGVKTGATQYTAAPVDATAQFTKADVETDPKSEVSLAPLDKFAKSIGVAPPPKPAAKPAPPKKPPVNTKVLAAAAGGALLLVLLGVWFIFRGPDGNETARVQLPDGGSVQVEQAGPQGPAPVGAVRSTLSPQDFFSVTPTQPTTPGSTSSSPPPPGDYALYTGHASTTLMLDLSGPVTLEAYITPSSKTDLLQTSLFGVNLINLRGGKTWSMVVWTSQGVKTASSNVAVVPGKKTHVAAVCTPTEMRLYVDGSLASRQSLSGSPPIKTPKMLEIGSQLTDLIDEIRVSKMERYTQNFTPQSRFASDLETLALYHCDEGAGTKLTDASAFGRHGTIAGPTWVRADGSALLSAGGSPISSQSATPKTTSFVVPPAVPPPPGDYALSFDGEWSHVVIPGWTYQGDHPLTVEIRAKSMRPAEDKRVEVVIGDPQSGGWNLGRHKENLPGSTEIGWDFSLNFGNYQGVWKQVPTLQNRWAHFAGVYDGKSEIRLYIDGRLQGRVSTTSDFRPSPAPLAIGANPDQNLRFNEFFQGLIDEVRISKRDRYNADFTPPARYEPDADTLALYHFDEGYGDVLRDASGQGLDGQITGATWVKADGSPIPSSSSPSSPATAAAPGMRWPLAPTKPELIQQLHQGQAVLTLRNGGFADLTVTPSDALPAGPATIVGIAFDRASKVTLQDDILRLVAECSDLESLSLDTGVKGQVSEQTLLQLAKLVELRRLSLPHSASPAAVDIVHSMPKLEFIALPYDFSNAWARSVAAHPMVKEVSAYRKKLADDGLAYLEKMPQLQMLDLIDTPVTQAAVDRFAAAVPGCEIRTNLGGNTRTIKPRTSTTAATPQPAADGFEPLFNGKDLTGWWTLAGGPGPWKVVDGAITCDGPLAYLFTQRDDFEDFHLRAEVKGNSGGNGGIYFRCSRDLSRGGHPTGFEAQILAGAAGDPQKTGSLYNIARVGDELVAPGAWYALEVIAEGARIRILVNGKQTVDYTDTARTWRRGPIALQHHSSGTKLEFRKLEIKELPAAKNSGKP